MTIKKYYQKGRLAMVGFDSLEEAFAFNHAKHLLEEVPSDELDLKVDKETINKMPEFQKWKKK